MLNNVGGRIAEERERLGKTQTEFAAAAGVGRASQQNYEANRRYPDATYLEAVAALGADVQYILTGVRSANLHQVAEGRGAYRAEKKGSGALSREEEVLVEKYRHLKPGDRTRAQAIVDALAESEVKKKKKSS